MEVKGLYAKIEDMAGEMAKLTEEKASLEGEVAILKAELKHKPKPPPPDNRELRQIRQFVEMQLQRTGNIEKRIRGVFPIRTPNHRLDDIASDIRKYSKN